MTKRKSKALDVADLIGAEKFRKQLHISGINMLNVCGQQFKFRYILGKKRPPSAFLIVGTGTDKAVSADLNNKIEKGVLLPEDVLTDIAVEHVTKEAPTIELGVEEKKLGREKVIAEAKDKAARLTRLHHGQVAPLIRPSRVSRKFAINMDKFLRLRAQVQRDAAGMEHDLDNKYAGKLLEQEAKNLYNASLEGWDFAGEQDIVEQYEEPLTPEQEALPQVPTPASILAIRDTKTSAKSPTQDAADVSEQLTAYAVASHVLDGKLPDALTLDYLVDTKEPKVVPRTSTRTMDDVGVFLNRFANAVHAIKSGIFVPTRPDDWHCSQKWCGYFDMCPYAKRPKLVSIGSAPTGGSDEGKEEASA